jgi:hypothetical protein
MITLLLTVAFIGFIAWAITYFVPGLPPKLITLIWVLAGIFIFFYIMNWFGVWSIGDFGGPRHNLRR